MLRYKAIEIFTSEGARYHKKSVVEAVLNYIHDLKIAARCIVTRGISGCYENGEIATPRLEILSFNLPVRIYIVIPDAETQSVLNGLEDMVTDGILALHDLNVLSHRTRTSFFPRQLMVRDVMTPNPESVKSHTPLSDAVRLLFSSIFTGLPVLDKNQRPIGIITQGDLMRKGGLPLRLGLLAESDQNQREPLLDQLSSTKVDKVMTVPVIVISLDCLLTEAVDLMIVKNLKRLPVVDGNRRLVGMLSRLDIFRTVMREAPDWKSFKAQKVEVENLKYVGDILRRDVHTVLPEASISEVIRLIDDNDIQRVAVVDAEEKLLGVISDRDLLRYFKSEQEGIWHLFTRATLSFKKEPCRTDLQQCLAETNAGAVMITDLVTAGEEMLIEEAIALMVDKALKRLPVVDTHGRFKGMISRDSLLRTGFA